MWVRCVGGRYEACYALAATACCDSVEGDRVHYLMFIVICFVWGMSFVLMKYAREVFGALTVGGGRVMSGAAALGVLVGMMWAIKKQQGGARVGVRNNAMFDWRKDGWAVLVPAFVGLGYPFAMQPHLIGKYANSSFFGMMVCLVPVLTIVVGVLMLGVWPRVREVVGVVGGGVGIWMLFGDAVEKDITVLDFCLAVSVPASYAVSNTFVKKRLGHVPAPVLGGMALGLGGLVILPLGLAAEPMDLAGGNVWWSLGCILILGVVGSGVAMWMMYELIHKRGPLFAGMVTYVVCSFAVLWGWVDGEAVTLRQVVALLVVLSMTALVQWPARKLKTCNTEIKPVVKSV